MVYVQQLNWLIQFSSSWYLPKRISDFQLKTDTTQLLLNPLPPLLTEQPRQPAPLLLTQRKNWFSFSWQESYFLQKYSSETFWKKKNPGKAQFAQFVSCIFRVPTFSSMAPTPCFYFPHSFYSLAYISLIILKAKAALSSMLSLTVGQVSLITLTELSPAQKYLAFPYLVIITCSHPPESTELCQVETAFCHWQLLWMQWWTTGCCSNIQWQEAEGISLEWSLLI